MSSSKHVLKGRCWKFGDNIMNDGGLMDHDFVKNQVWDQDVLKHHCLEKVNPDFAKSAKPGDILVAGRKFAHGNFHIQGFLGLKGLGVGVLVESMPRGTFRLAINTGVHVLPSCPDITKYIDDGDLLEVDFEKGKILNRSKGKTIRAEPIHDILLEIIKEGGELGYIKKVLSG